jgi:hypothetical protein
VGYASSKSRAPTEDAAIVCLVRIDFLPVSDAAASAGRPEDRSVLEMMYGRDEEDWDQLADTGLAFLVERARLAKLTSYTELNATLERRTELPGFDFARADERAAMGHLLYLIVERNRPATNLMISALVTYLDANDAGTGFYAFAQDLGLLPRNASAQARLEFWVRQVDALYRYYSPRRQQDTD